MNIGLVQSIIIWEDKGKNIIEAESTIARHSGIELFLFPEMSFTGFSMNTDLTAEFSRETVVRMSDIAKKYNVNIGFGWVRKKASKSENVYTILDSSGKLISEYVKIHPFSYSGEDKYFQGGEDIKIFSISNIPFTTFICYDLRFLEVFRTVADSIHAIIIPANWPAKRSEHWKTLLRARAIENQVYIFAINCQGDIGGQYYSGYSCIINPDGEVLEILSDKTGVISFDFVDDVDSYREKFPVLRDVKKF